MYQPGGGRHLSTASCNNGEASQNENAGNHILSLDTDVLFLALAYIPRLGENQCLLIGHEKSRELIVLKPIHDA